MKFVIQKPRGLCIYCRANFYGSDDDFNRCNVRDAKPATRSADLQRDNSFARVTTIYGRGWPLQAIKSTAGLPWVELVTCSLIITTVSHKLEALRWPMDRATPRVTVDVP